MSSGLLIHNGHENVQIKQPCFFSDTLSLSVSHIHLPQTKTNLSALIALSTQTWNTYCLGMVCVRFVEPNRIPMTPYLSSTVSGFIFGQSIQVVQLQSLTRDLLRLEKNNYLLLLTYGSVIFTGNAQETHNAALLEREWPTSSFSQY